MTETHLKYSGSQIPRIIRCPGSVAFIHRLASEGTLLSSDGSIYAKEGSMLHEQTEEKLLHNRFSKDLSKEQENTVLDNVNWFTGLVKKFDLTWHQVEQKVTLTNYGLDNCGGTADIIAGHKKETLHIVDWKYGQGVPVSAYKNEQLMTYLLGAAEAEENLKAYSELWIHIGQPRLSSFSSYNCSCKELLEHLEKIRAAVKASYFKAGEIQCRWCPAKLFCAEYKDFISTTAVSVFKQNELMAKNEISFESMAKLLTLESSILNAFKAIKKHLASLPDKELKVLGLKRVAGRSFRHFVSEEQVVQYLCENYGDIEDIYETPKLKSPAKLEKAIRGLKKDPNFQKLIIKPMGKPTIVSINDSRPEYSQEAVSAFAHLAETEKKN